MTNLSGHLAVSAYLGQPEPHYWPGEIGLRVSLLVTRGHVNRNVQCYAEEHSGPVTRDSGEESSDLVSEAGPQSDIRGLEPSIIGLLLVLISSGAQPRPQHACTRHRYPEENSCGHVYQHQQNFLFMIRFGNRVVEG